MKPTPTASANPHVLWRQVAGFVFWVGLMILFLVSTDDVVLATYLSVIGGVTFEDAWRSGIYNNPEKKSLSDISPMGWGILMAMPMFFIFTYPMYLINRNELRTLQAGNGFFIATIVLGAVLYIHIIVTTVLMVPGAVEFCFRVLGLKDY